MRHAPAAPRPAASRPCVAGCCRLLLARLRCRRCSPPTASSASSRPTASTSCRATWSRRSRPALVKPGMTPPQVRDILGSPLLTDPFHADRWDYVFTIRRQGTEPQRRSVVVLFDGDMLKSLEAAASCPPSASSSPRSTPSSAARSRAALALTDEQLKALPVPPQAAAAAGRREPDRRRTRTYPPLGAGMTAMREPLRIAVAGASGRMGRMLIEAVLASARLRAGRRARRRRQPGASARTPAPSLGRASGVRITADLRAGLAGAAGADRLHPPRRHAGAPGGVPRARRARRSSAPPASATAQKAADRRARRAHRRSCWRRT